MIYKKKYHDEASTIATHLSAYLFEAYGEPILSIFSLEYQDQACSCVWENGQPLFLEEKELETATAMEFDFLVSLDNDSTSSKKRVHLYEEDNLTIESTKTADYFNPTQDIIMDVDTKDSARGLARPSVPK